MYLLREKQFQSTPTKQDLEGGGGGEGGYEFNVDITVMIRVYRIIN